MSGLIATPGQFMEQLKVSGDQCQLLLSRPVLDLAFGADGVIGIGKLLCKSQPNRMA
jgi:hypothetical protein